MKTSSLRMRRAVVVAVCAVTAFTQVAHPITVLADDVPECAGPPPGSTALPQRFAFGQQWFNGRCLSLPLTKRGSEVDATLVALGAGTTPSVRVFYTVNRTPHAQTPSTADPVPSLTKNGAVDAGVAARDDRLELEAFKVTTRSDGSTAIAGTPEFTVQWTPLGACADVSAAALSCSVDGVKLRAGGANGSAGSWSGVATVDITSLLPVPDPRAGSDFPAPAGRTLPSTTLVYQLRLHDAATPATSSNALFGTSYGQSAPVTIAVVYDLDANAYRLNPAVVSDALSSGGNTKARVGVDYEQSANLRLRIAAAAGMRYTNKPSVNDAASTLLGQKPDPGFGFNATDSDAYEFLKFSKNAPDGLKDALSNVGGDIRFFKLGSIPQTDAGLKLVFKDKGTVPAAGATDGNKTKWTGSVGAISYRSTGDKNVPDATDSAFTLTASASTSKAEYGAALTDVVASRTVKIANLLAPPGATSTIGSVTLGFPVVLPTQIHTVNVGTQLSYRNKASNLATLLRLGDGGTDGAASDVFAAETWKIVSPSRTLETGGVANTETDLGAGWRKTDIGFNTQLGDAMAVRGTQGPWYAVSHTWKSTKPSLSQSASVAMMQSRWISERGVEQFVSQGSLSYGVNQLTLRLSGTHSRASLRLLAQQDYDNPIPLGSGPVRLFPVDRAGIDLDYKTDHAHLKVGYASINETNCANQLPPGIPTPSPSTATIVSLTCRIPRTHGSATLLLGGDISKKLSAYASYGQAVREGSSPLVSARKQIFGSLRYRMGPCDSFGVDAVNRAGYDAVKDTAGSEYYANLLFHVPIGRARPKIRLGYSYVNTYDIALSPTQKHQFSVQLVDLLRSADQVDC